MRLINNHSLICRLFGKNEELSINQFGQGSTVIIRLKSGNLTNFDYDFVTPQATQQHVAANKCIVSCIIWLKSQGKSLPNIVVNEVWMMFFSGKLWNKIEKNTSQFI